MRYILLLTIVFCSVAVGSAYGQCPESTLLHAEVVTVDSGIDKIRLILPSDEEEWEVKLYLREAEEFVEGNVERKGNERVFSALSPGSYIVKVTRGDCEYVIVDSENPFDPLIVQNRS